MNKTLLIIFWLNGMFWSTYSSVHCQISISESIMVADQDLWGNTRPKMALNASGNAVVIWTNISASNVYCSLKNGNTFTSPIQLNPVGLSISAFDWSGPEISSNGDDIFVVFKETPEDQGGIFCVKSNDGGVSWGDTVRVNPGETMLSRMPAIGVSSSGNPLVAFMREDLDAMFSEWVVCSSSDGGESFDLPISATVMNGDEVCDCCPASLAISDDNIALLYRNNNDNVRDIHAAISDNGAISFDQNIDMDDLDWTIAACPSSGPQGYWVGNELRSIWMSGQSGIGRTYFSSYDIVSGILIGPELIEEVADNQVQNFPSIAGDELITGVVIEQIQSGQRDLFFAWGVDGFSETNYFPITTAIDGNQLRPDLVFDSSGWHIVYSDNGNDAVMYRTIGLISGLGNLLSAPFSFSLFPNPAQSHVFVKKNYDSNEMKVCIYDQLGREIYSSNGPWNWESERVKIELDGLSNGSYTVGILHAAGTSVHKLFVTD